MNFLALMYSLIINLPLYRKLTEPSQEKTLLEVLIKPLTKLIQKISHEISPCKIQCFVKQSGYEDYGHDYTLQD